MRRGSSNVEVVVVVVEALKGKSAIKILECMMFVLSVYKTIHAT